MKLPKSVNDLMKKFEENGAEIFIVGGAVRDMLLEREVKDWDFTTNLTPEKMLKIFPKNSFYNNDFGTFSVVISKKQIFEITTYRTDIGHTDRRHPDVVRWGKSLKEDTKRRDFTINAIAMDRMEKIYDFHKGKDDLKNNLIKTVGNPDKRFGEDALRMIRAVRLAAQLKFVIEEKTFESIQKNAQLITNIAFERIREELFLLLGCERSGDGVIILKNSGLLAQIMPEVLEGVGMVQKGHHIYDVWKHSIEALNNCQSVNPVTKLATFLHDIGKPVTIKGEGEDRTFYNHEVVGSRIAVKIGKRLRLSKKELDQLFRLVRWHMFTVEDTQTDKAVRRFIRNVTPEYLEEMISLRRSDRIGSGAKESSWRWELFKKRLIEVQKQPFSVTDLKINGKDVMEILGIKPGRKVGEVLDTIFAKVEKNPKLNDREVLMGEIKKLSSLSFEK